MSGLEVISGISAVIGILDAAVKIYGSAGRDLKLPKTFTVVRNRLPIILETLQICKDDLQPMQDSMSPDVYDSFTQIVNVCQENAKTLRTIFEAIIPGESDTWGIRYRKLIKRLGNGSRVEELMISITQDVQLMVNNRAVRSAKADQIIELENIIKELEDEKISVIEDERTAFTFHTGGGAQTNSLNTGSGQQINNLGSVGTQNFNQISLKPKEDFSFRKPAGVCLGQAPCLDPKLFVGRSLEMEEMGKHLNPGVKSDEQRRLVLGGVGGIGKTQLAISYLKMHHTHYDSVFWLNASSQASVNASLRSIAELAFDLHAPDKLMPEEALIRTRQWLSDTKNTRWLLIFDNYDDPEQFMIETYFPPASHGAIIITTRRPDLSGGTHLRVQPLQSIKEGLSILGTRSSRQGVTDDPHAKRLAERLAGHPLALATAGAFLHYSALSFERYLHEYERRWDIDPRRQYRLREYGDRTLYTTWDISYSRLEEEDSDAARLLTLLAYFDNQSLEYKLFHAGLTETAPEALRKVISDDLNFNNAMASLTRYCFLDIHPTLGYWSMQNCVHDWTLAVLNEDICPEYYGYATNCVVAIITGINEHSLVNAAYAPLAGHAQWLVQQRFLQNASILAHAPHSLHQISCLSRLLHKQDRLAAAECAYVWALARYGQALQVHGVPLLQTIHNLASVYHSQGKLHEAKDLYGKVLLLKLDVLGEDNESTLHTLHNLGALNHQEGRATVAMEILQRALKGREKVLGESAISTLDTVNVIGAVHHDLGRLKEAESMYIRALEGKIQALGAKHPSTLYTLRDLAGLSTDMRAFDDAEKLHKVALIAYSEVFGEDHPSTLQVVNRLGNLYKAQGKFGDAEQMYHLALAGLGNALGPDQISCLHILGNLGNLYGQLAKFGDAERMHTKALVGFRQAVGEDHPSTLETYSALGEDYLGQRNAVKAEDMYRRALDGYKRKRDADNLSTLSIALKLGAIYGELERTSEAEELLSQARDGFERTLGDDHFLTLNAVFNLGHVYTEQHRLDEAETMYSRAFYGYERMFGKSHTYTADAATHLLELYTQQGRLNDAKRISLCRRRGKNDEEHSGDSSGSTTEPAFALPGLRMLLNKISHKVLTECLEDLG